MFYDDDMLEKAKQLSQSINYQFCNRYLPSFFFYKPEVFAICFKKHDFIKELLNVVVNVMKENKLDAEKYNNLTCEFRVDRDNKIAGIIIELLDAKIEPECNYVCVCFDDREPKYFESELYEEGNYGLCSRNKEGNHINHGIVGGDIKTVDNMWDAVVEEITKGKNYVQN